MSTRAITWALGESPLWHVAGLLLRPLHLALAFPSILYVGAMTVFLFKPPDLFFYNLDRIAFGILVFFVSLRALALRERIPFFPGISIPMLGLLILAISRLLREPFDVEVWSVIASKYIVPFSLFHIAVLVFRTAEQRRHLEVLIFAVLAYLIFIAIAFLFDARSLILPRCILDEGMGFHPDRARGPFLQAVANGVSLNLLGILVLVLPRVNRKLVWILWILLPLAILATMTRAVWISFALSTLAVGLLLIQRRLQAACIAVVVVGLIGGLAFGLSDHSLKHALWDRTGERGPVEARVAVYDAGWEMFRQRPFTGWPAGKMYAELARRMEGFHLRTFYVHNTYLALLVEFGVPGLALYAILFFNLFRLGRPRSSSDSRSVAMLRKIWPILLGVYLLNAFFVDMAYQFVIGLLFTVAGILCAEEAAA